MSFIDIDCLEVTQPVGKFYVGAIQYKDLLDICFVDIRKLANKQDELEEYTGIQRTLDGGRVGKIKRYLDSPDATFPTSIILAVNSSDVNYDSVNKKLQIKNSDNVAKIIDGQHRIRGLEGYARKENFQLNVTIFIDLELEEQALIFATINLSQTKVNSSLVADLFEFTKVRSPQKTCHNICKALNEKSGSPFKDKIKILGVADDKEKETITQANFVEQVIIYITEDRVKDRNIYKRGGVPRLAIKEELKKLFLRNLFIEDKDGDIAKILWNYFKAVETKWSQAWSTPQPSIILNRSTGFVALMRFFKDAYLYLAKNDIGTVPSVADFITIFDKVSLKDTDFTKENFIPGSSGRVVLYKRFKDDTKI